MAEEAPAVIDKGGVLVVQAEPLADLVEFTRQERDRRVAVMLERVGI